MWVEVEKDQLTVRLHVALSGSGDLWRVAAMLLASGNVSNCIMADSPSQCCVANYLHFCQQNAQPT